MLAPSGNARGGRARRAAARDSHKSPGPVAGGDGEPVNTSGGLPVDLGQHTAAVTVLARGVTDLAAARSAATVGHTLPGNVRR